jgi:Uma2 family endonuclease
VVEVGNELTRNIRIAQKLLLTLLAEQGGHGVYTNSISVEVERSQKEERIPDVLVVSEDCDTCFTQASQRLLDDAPGIVTLAMPAPILVVEVISPSSVKADLEEKPFEMMERGVGEYVSIDWRKEVVQVWSCTEDGKNYNFSEYCSGERVILNSFPALTITVDEMIMKP